ncbi:MAG: dipeptide/oligopeptide/nickel ABC transporter permease/ATP-binding protein, partial [Sneathiellales bacterium]|nr:dipeptide/oligopeptide/nickel ABC transporter permease/ATP-binding protein [Sneathiellales bacterium]
MKSLIALVIRNRLALLGGIVLSLILLLMVLTPLLPIADPDLTDPANRLKTPFTFNSLLGTDHLGRDLFSRLLWGTQLSLAVGFAAAVIAAVIGSTIGIISGYFGGRTDNLIMRGIDMLMAFPYILLALAIVAVLGPGLINALYAVAVVNIPFFARNIRGVTIGIVHREFVDAARLSGKSDLEIILTEILPNVVPIIVVAASTTIGWMILETAGLSFLGLGSQPPQADLGSMLGEGRKLLFNAPHVSVVPGVMIFLIVMSVNLLGDGIRDALDPRLKSGALARPAAATHTDFNDHMPETVSSHQDTILSVKKLKTEFHASKRVYQAVNHVSLDLKKGECLGIIGESGSGKSVTALSLMRLVASPPGKIVEGQVLFSDYENEPLDTLRLSPEDLRRLRGAKISYIFQDPLATLHPLFSIGDQMVEAIQCHRSLSNKEAWQHAVKLLELVKIPNAAARAHNYPHEMSGGMRQRVSIAMALVNDPEIIIADEPTTALDVTVQAQILRLLNDLRKERQMSVIFITHDFGVVSQICDRIAVMYGGRIIEVGTTAAILEKPYHPYTDRLIDCVPKLGEGKRT